MCMHVHVVYVHVFEARRELGEVLGIQEDLGAEHPLQQVVEVARVAACFALEVREEAREVAARPPLGLRRLQHA